MHLNIFDLFSYKQTSEVFVKTDARDEIQVALHANPYGFHTRLVIARAGQEDSQPSD